MVIIFGKPGCRFCGEAVQLAKDMELHYFYVDILENETARQWLKDCGFQTVPQIFTYTGDFTDWSFSLAQKAFIESITGTST